jgi:hypothetical protein
MWKCITEDCKIVDGVWNNQGVAYYSISDIVGVFRDVLLNFIISFAPVIFFLLFTILIIYFMIHVFKTIKDVINIV